MSVNGVTNGMSNAYAAQHASRSAKETAKANKTTENESGVVYEPSTSATDSTDKKMTDYSSIISNLKNEVSNRNKQLENLVQKLLTKQAGKYTSLSDLFKNLEVDEETRAQAQQDIGEDGYWGVNQTSDRLVSMAQALSGGDPEKADELIAAMKKGFEQATKAWGDDLPEICQKTIDAATKKLENWRDGVTE